ncbi:hypothetical protein QJS04_geneDACA000655 [Acorus gramineus]|uniref:Protein kinase domain-containing protein n=1 Tax=Acorus gramineus TaxID=55184 RepID=A0AAV9AQ26_ACOGR|nr:hypothetical protein QJS04_geneDACA000655 [Acorus gramineus]
MQSLSKMSILSAFLTDLLLSSEPSKASSSTCKSSSSSAPSSQTTVSSSNTTLTVSSFIGKSTESLPTPRTEFEILSSSNLKAFTFGELRNATRNFRPDSLIGEGGFGYVFKGWIDEQTLAPAKPGSGIVVAVKRLKPEGFQGHKEWLEYLYYTLLLLEYQHRVLSLLIVGGAQPLPWAIRMKVAVGAARGLAFLHNAESQIIYRDEFNVKLSDFGLAKAGPTGDKTHVSTQVMGTHGYAAPEYIATGRLSVKADVYSFGVVLLELLSGRRALDKSMIGVEQSLVDWAKPYIGDKRKLFRIMDTKFGGQYPKKGAFSVASMALQCISSEAKQRPTMSEVLAVLEGLLDLKELAKITLQEQEPEQQQTLHSPLLRSPRRLHQGSPLHYPSPGPGGSPLPAHRQPPFVR